jgi:hypothetical protein
MVDISPTKIYEEYYCLLRLRFKLIYILENLVVNERDEQLSGFLESIKSILDKISFNRSEFNNLLDVYIESSNKTDFNELYNFCKQHFEKVEASIAEIPSDIAKSYNVLRALINIKAYIHDSHQGYDAIVLLKDEISPAVRNEIYLDWKKSEKDSFDYLGIYDAVSHARIQKIFGFSEFDPIFNDIDSKLEFKLVEDIFSEDLPQLAYDLWLLDRIPDFVNYNRDLVNIALKCLVKSQDTEGFWFDIKTTPKIHSREISEKEFKTPKELGFWETTNLQYSSGDNGIIENKLEYPPNNYITALCSLNLIKNSISDNLKEKGIIGTQWLLNNQNADGSWFKSNNESESDLFTTILCLEALFRSNIPNIEHSLKLGLDWIEEQQDHLGNWDLKFPDFSSSTLSTVIVLESIKLISNHNYNISSSFLSISKDFLNSSMRLLSDESLNSRRLAIVSAYHGIEFFLYSILVKDDINLNIYSRGGKTIGMVEALKEFEDYLKSKNELNQGANIDYKNSLIDLKNHRDDIIHRGHGIDEAKCTYLINEARLFTSKFSFKIFKIDILN